MLQRNSNIIYIEEEAPDDTPLEGKKSCMAEAYREGLYDLSEATQGETKLLN